MVGARKKFLRDAEARGLAEHESAKITAPGRYPLDGGAAANEPRGGVSGAERKLGVERALPHGPSGGVWRGPASGLGL